MKWKLKAKLENKIDSFVKDLKQAERSCTKNDKKDLKTTILTRNPTGRFNCSRDGNEVYDVITGKGISIEDI